MKSKVVNIVFCGVFVLALLMPLVFADPLGGSATVRENRVLAVRPPLSLLGENPGAYIARFDAWFSDNLGFREILLNAHDKINVLAESDHYSDGRYIYVKGKEGHRFFADENGVLIRKFQGKHKLVSGAIMPEFAEAMGDIKAYLDEKGVPLIVMFGAGKETVYPEFYPESIASAPYGDQLDELTAYIKAAGVDVFSIKSRLLKEKQAYPVFVKADGDLAHCNEIGVFFAYDELMKRLRSYLPGVAPISLEDVNISYNENYTAEVSLKFDRDWRALGDEFFDGVELIRPYTEENLAFENDDPSLPRILCFRDSDMGNEHSGMGRLLPHNFSTTIYIHYSNIGNFKDYIELFKPDIVVLESAERALSMFANIIIENRLAP